MSAAHSWLEPVNWPRTPYPRERLEERIERVLTMTNIGVLSTIGKDRPPRGLPMRLDPERVAYTEHFRRERGYAPRQIWCRHAEMPAG